MTCYGRDLIRFLTLGMMLLFPHLAEGRSAFFASQAKNVETSFHKESFSRVSVVKDVDVTEINKQLMSCFPRGGCCCSLRTFFAGWNPFGYGLTALGKQYLEFEGSLDSDIGRFLASLKSGRKSKSTLKDQWLEVIRVSKKGQSLRVYRTLDQLIDFCIKAGFIF